MKKLLLCLCLLSVPAIAGDNPRTPTDDANVKDLYMNKQNRRFVVYTSTPTASDLGEGEVVLFYSGAAFRVYTKINGNLKKVSLE